MHIFRESLLRILLCIAAIILHIVKAKESILCIQQAASIIITEANR